jgi:poly-gamma-glutamate synthesis protein (capsule biosynthesis protein)
MEASAITLAVTGDLVLDEPDAAYWLSGIATALHGADLAIGHLEVPHTLATHEMAGDIPAPGAPPENLAALAEAGFDLVTLAGNHIADCGPQGIADTIAGLARYGIGHCGAGADLAAARRPAIADIRDTRVALLSYNCVGPEASWAQQGHAGCAYLPMGTRDGSPVSPRAQIDRVLPEAVEILAQDIAAARGHAAFVIVALHKGVVHTPALLQPYEREIARAAIEHGADAVISHHAHIARGIEFHLGRPILHGLGNGCVVTRALSPAQDHPARSDWARRRRELFGFEPDPAYTLAPFHPEAVNAFIGIITLSAERPAQVRIVPVYVEPPGRPVLASEAQGRAIARYLERITLAAGLPPIHIDNDMHVSALAA